MGELRPELYSGSPFPLPFPREQLNEYDSRLGGILRESRASNDLDLVQASQSGDVSAFDQLVGRYDLASPNCSKRHAQSGRFLRRGSGELVEGPAAFERIPGAFATLDLVVPITVNQALTKLRKRRTTKGVSLD